MRISRFKIQFFLFSATLITLLPLTSVAASSWSQEPAWARQDNTPTPSRRSLPREKTPKTSPFAPGSNNVAIEVGQVFLMGDLATNYEDNLGVRLHYTYGVSDMFGFDSSLGYSNHSEGRYSMTSLLTGLRTNLTWFDRVIPYAVFGLGFYKPSIEINETSSVSQVLFGLHLGPGVDLQITDELFFGASLSFHDVFGATKRTANGIQELGGTYTDFLVHAGYSF